MAQIHINTIVDICAQHGIEKAIISPGSRNAPLIIAFNRHPKLKCYSISDERSAAFIALGMAQATKNTVAIICTSGSAALNYAPAVAEAFFQQTPLLVITADRPPEWIDQWDGQTIRQQNIYGNHTKNNYNLHLLNEDRNSQILAYRMVNEACIQANNNGKGPVHLNIPFREPFYPTENEAWRLDENAKYVKYHSAPKTLTTELTAVLKDDFNQFKNVVFLLGQDDYSEAFLTALDETAELLNIPIFADVISNGHKLKHAIRFTDANALAIKTEEEQKFQPELIISFGRSIISKNLKLFLRNAKLKQWHIDADKATISDPFTAISKMIASESILFLEAMRQFSPKADKFLDRWKQLDIQTAQKIQGFLANQSQFNEFSSLNTIIASIPANAHVHLANSLSVRYANFIGLNTAKRVWSNRGTSGIDGSNSTAIGHALANPDEQHFLITGDVAFFYDRNAFWHKYNLSNLKIILINNKGGSIFRMIKGPGQQAELEEFFETEQRLDASKLCEEFNIDYFPVQEQKQLKETLSNWASIRDCSLLEIQTNSLINQEIFETFKRELKN